MIPPYPPTTHQSSTRSRHFRKHLTANFISNIQAPGSSTRCIKVWWIASTSNSFESLGKDTTKRKCICAVALPKDANLQRGNMSHGRRHGSRHGARESKLTGRWALCEHKRLTVAKLPRSVSDRDSASPRLHFLRSFVPPIQMIDRELHWLVTGCIWVLDFHFVSILAALSVLEVEVEAEAPVFL